MEFNDPISSAEDIQKDECIAGTIGTENDYDYYKINLYDPEMLSLSIEDKEDLDLKF